MSLEALNLGMHQVVRLALPRLRGHAPTTARAHEGLLLLLSKQNVMSPFTVGKSEAFTSWTGSAQRPSTSKTMGWLSLTRMPPVPQEPIKERFTFRVHRLKFNASTWEGACSLGYKGRGDVTLHAALGEVASRFANSHHTVKT